MLEGLILIAVIFGIAFLIQHLYERSRRKKVDVVGDDSVLVLAEGCYPGFKVGIWSNVKLYRSDRQQPERLDQKYAQIVRNGITAYITDRDKKVSEKLTFTRPPSGILYIMNKYNKRNAAILIPVRSAFFAIIFLDKYIPVIDQYSGLLIGVLLGLYLLYYFVLYKAEYVIKAYTG